MNIAPPPVMRRTTSTPKRAAFSGSTSFFSDWKLPITTAAECIDPNGIPDAIGQLELDGAPVQLQSTNDAVDRGISIIHQELNLCANLSVRDNIFIGRELRTRTGTVDYAQEGSITEQLMRRLEEPIRPGTLVQDLRVGQQQIIEIARALAADARILIMDEPTSALSANEVEVLFKVIRDLTSHGVAIVYISHHLEEAIEIADHAVVFRDGELVATERAENIDLPWVVRQMVGRDADYDFRLTGSSGRGRD